MADNAASDPASSNQPLLSEDRREAQDMQHQEAREEGPRAHYNWHRRRVREVLSSKAQHYFVLTLVSLDILSILADIFIVLYTCEAGKPNARLDKVRESLGIACLIFSCLFMVELTLSVWAFGWQYFQSWFHCLDAMVILAGFVIDVLLKGVLEEVASLVVVLRLWRFIKIVEEFGVGAEEQMDALNERLEMVEQENEQLKAELRASKCSSDPRITDEEMG